MASLVLLGLLAPPLVGAVAYGRARSEHRVHVALAREELAAAERRLEELASDESLVFPSDGDRLIEAAAARLTAATRLATLEPGDAELAARRLESALGLSRTMRRFALGSRTVPLARLALEQCRTAWDPDPRPLALELEALARHIRAGEFFERAVARQNRKNPAPTIADDTEGLRIDPERPLALAGRAVAYTWAGDLDKAIADLDAAIALEPNYVEALINRGHAYERRGNLERARADLDRALKLLEGRERPEGGGARAYYFRAKVRAKLKDRAGTEEDLERYLAADPEGVFATEAQSALAKLRKP